MIPLKDPIRLVQHGATPASLRHAIRLATQIEPTPQELRQLQSALSALRSSRMSGGFDIATHSGLRRSPRRKIIVGVRVAAAILAACLSVTWASVRFLGSSVALHSWISLGDTAERAAPGPVHPATPVEHGPGESAARPTVAVPFAPALVQLRDRPDRAAKRGKAHAPLREEPPAPEPTAIVVEAPVVPVPPPPSEARILLQARRALRVDPAQALRWVREHERRFPDGSLSQEREVLAIEALRGIGRPSEADARLARFRERYPGSIHDRRIDSPSPHQAPHDEPARAISEPDEVGASHLQDP